MSEKKIFQASQEAKGKAKQLRAFAILAWLLAMAGQVFAIFKLISNETFVWLIVAIVVILILAITGSLLWKKANRLDPASEKNKFKFFVQNQLGAIMGALAFLPLVILIFTNKNISGNNKKIAGGVAALALVVAGITGTDFNPPSIEKYTEEINQQNDDARRLNIDSDNVYWSNAGNKYHAESSCYHIKNKELANGSIKQSWEQKGISELCKTCMKKAEKTTESIIPSTVDELIETE